MSFLPLVCAHWGARCEGIGVLADLLEAVDMLGCLEAWSGSSQCPGAEGLQGAVLDDAAAEEVAVCKASPAVEVGSVVAVATLSHLVTLTGAVVEVAVLQIDAEPVEVDLVEGVAVVASLGADLAAE